MSEALSRVAGLRAATQAAHTQIETVPALARLPAADLTRAEYVAVLQRLHGFHATFEPALAARLSAHPEAASLLDGGRITALEADLAWFGAAPLPRPTGLAAADDHAVPDDIGAALGALYVIEGSGLGARVIARHLAQSLGVAAGSGASFYAGQDAASARARWRRVCALLEAAGEDPAIDGRLAEGAIATFRCLEHGLRRIGIDPAGDMAARGAGHMQAAMAA